MGVVYSRISSSSDQQAILRHSLQFFAWWPAPTPKLRPTQRPSPGWDMVDFMATVVWVLDMVVTEVTALDMATERGPLMLRPSPRPMPGWDTVDSTATVVLALDMAVMAMVDLATDMARGPLMPRLSRGWDTVDSTATVVLALAMADSDTDMARGPLMLRLSPRPMPITDMVAFTATDSQLMAATAMDLDSMARSKQNQIPRLTIS